jgi:glycosyltransferase involved in cell wall biosynthesis
VKVGVVIPTFDRAAVLAETVESALAQSPPPDEIVIVDDGSTDDTRAVMEPFVRRGVRYVYQKNAFQGAARNKGQAVLSTDVTAVLFLDSDDLLLPGALRRLAGALADAPEAVLAYGRPIFMDAAGRPTRTSWGIEDFEGADLWPRLVRRNFICTPGCALVRRDALRRAGDWDTSLRGVEDWDMWLRLAEGAGRFVQVPTPAEPVLRYRVHSQSVSRDRGAMLAMEEALLRKHLERAAEDPARRAHVDQALSLRAGRRVASGAAGAPLDDEALLSRRHRLLRRLIERTGVATLYRRMPLALRLRLRDGFGVDRWA